MNPPIRFVAKAEKKKIYYGKKGRLMTNGWMSAVMLRPTLTLREENRKRHSISKKPVPLRPLNEIVISRISIKVHRFECHSPKNVMLRTKQMWLRWQPKFERIGRSADYMNKYSLHKFL